MDNNRKVYEALPKILAAYIEDLYNDNYLYTDLKKVLGSFNQKAPIIFSRELRSLSSTILRLHTCKHEIFTEHEDTQECKTCGAMRNRLYDEDQYSSLSWTKPDTWEDWR